MMNKYASTLTPQFNICLED